MADIFQLSRQNGFSYVAELCMEALKPMPEVRDMCASGRCQRYDRCWSCPPGCGTIEHAAKQMSQYAQGVIVQTVGKLQDEFDIEGIGRVQEQHRKAFDALARQARIVSPGCLPLTAGTCTICHKCTWPDKPCRFPNRRLSSMEAYGLLVSDVCLKSGLQYNYGAGTISFTSCILF
jgi:predicted metal-binding protein